MLINIVRHQITEGLRDAKFLFLAAVVLATFIANGIVYADRYNQAHTDYMDSIAGTTRMLETRAGNLQEITSYPQSMMKPPSALAFLADEGEELLPNELKVNAFRQLFENTVNRGNELFPLLPAVDWVFIIGTVMTLMALMLSFTSVCGEKRDGTLRQLLSYPVPRIKLLAGKYLGSLMVIAGVLILGGLISITILYFSGALPLSEMALTAIGWAFVAGLLCLSLILLTGLAISSLVHRPAIALVILMIFWLVSIVAVPGLARLVGENLVQVPSTLDVEQEQSAKWEEIQSSAPFRTFNWSGTPEYRFSNDAQNRAKYVALLSSTMQRISDEATQKRIRQAELIKTISCASPSGLLADAFQRISGTGISGYKTFRETARRYTQQVYNFAVERDKLDPTTPHNVYSWATSVDEGTYSTLPVELSTFPRSQTLWLEGGLSPEVEWPLLHLILLFAVNLQMAIVAIIAISCYDPR